MMAWVRAMSGLGPRRAGSAAGHQCEDFLHDQLVGLGLTNVRKEPIAVEVWEPDEARLAVRDGATWRELPAQWIPHCAWTPPDLEAPLVLAPPSGRGSGAWRGKIVVAEIRFPMLNAGLLERLSLGTHDPDHDIAQVRHPATWIRLGWHLYRRAAAAGARGFIGVLRDQPGGTHKMYAPYGFKEADILDKPLPGVWVGRAEGDRLIELARQGAPARLAITGTRRTGVTHNVVGELPGGDFRTGVTVPGVPGLVMGRTRAIAGGFTYGFADTIDFVIEDVQAGLPRVAAIFLRTAGPGPVLARARQLLESGAAKR